MNRMLEKCIEELNEQDAGRRTRIWWGKEPSHSLSTDLCLYNSVHFLTLFECWFSITAH